MGERVFGLLDGGKDAESGRGGETRNCGEHVCRDREQQRDRHPCSRGGGMGAFLMAETTTTTTHLASDAANAAATEHCD